MLGDPDRLALLVPELLGVLLIYSGTAKIGDYGKSLSASLLDLELPVHARAVVTFGLCEVILGMALALTSTRITMLLTMAIGLLFAAFGLRALAKRRIVSCNCGAIHGRLGWRQISMLPLWIFGAFLGQRVTQPLSARLTVLVVLLASMTSSLMWRTITESLRIKGIRLIFERGAT